MDRFAAAFAVAVVGSRSRRRRWCGVRAELTFHHPSVRGEPLQRGADDGDAESQPGCGLGGGERSVGAGITRDEVAQRVSDRFDEGQRHTHRQRNTEGVAQAGGVLHGGVALGAADVDFDGAVGALEGDQMRGRIGDGGRAPGGRFGGRILGKPSLGKPSLGKPSRARLRRRCRVGRKFKPGGDFRRVQRAEQAEQVRDPLEPAHLAVRREPLQLPLGGVNDLGIEQFAQLDPAQEFVEQGRIQRQRGGPALGQRGIALVEELRDVAKEQGLGEGRRLLGGGLQNPQLAALDGRGDVLEGRKVVHVLQAFAHGLEDDRERGVLSGDVQQLRGALALLPQGLPFAGVLPGQQQGPGGALTETGGEQRAAADLRRHDLFEFLRIEQEQLGPGRLVLHHGHAQHDPVVGGHRGAVQPKALVQSLPDGQGPRRVHRHAERAVQHHPPVAKFVVETLHHQGRVAGDHLGGQLLLGEVLDEVVGGEIVQAAGFAAFHRRADVGRGEFAHERAQGAAQVHRAAEGVTLPEREFSRLAESRGDQDPVVGDVLDLPAGGAQGEHVADPGFVDHFLVELSHPAAALRRRRGRAGRPAVAAGGARGS
ncbi:hypothetical protein BJQ90_02830 [Arthrobacter sp. SO3]|nr:hypothetical protein [Arthrobacter sp. SO3]